MNWARALVPIRGWVLAAGLLLGWTELLLRLASLGPTPLTIDVGPATGAYLEGFTESWEYLPVIARFGGEWARVSVPLVSSSGEMTLLGRFGFFGERAASLTVVAGWERFGRLEFEPASETIEQWVRRGRQGSPFGDFETRRAALLHGGGPFRLGFLSEASQAFSYALDWIRVEGGHWRLPLSIWQPRFLVLAAFTCLLWSGFSLARAWLVAGSLAGIQAIWAAFDPFGLMHVSLKLALPATLLSFAVSWLFRNHSGRAWLVLLFFVGILLKGACLFQPSFFYSDVRTHRRYLLVFAEAEGSLLERGAAAQRSSRLAFREFGEKLYPFPYSPLFYLPFTPLTGDTTRVDESMKQVALAAGALEVAAVFWLASLVASSRAALFAAAMSAFLAPMFGRLSLAMWPSITAHLFDCLALGMAVRLAAAPRSWRRLLGFAAVSLSSLLIYVGSLFTVSGFALLWALLQRSVRGRILVTTALLASVTVFLLYRDFLGSFVNEILPVALVSGAAAAPANAAVTAPLIRFTAFFGWGHLVLLLVGSFLLYRRARPEHLPPLAAYGLTLVIFLLIRGFELSLFRNLKEILFAGPLVALTAGVSLEFLESRGPKAKVLAIALAIGLGGIGLMGAYGYFAPKLALAGR